MIKIHIKHNWKRNNLSGMIYSCTLFFCYISYMPAYSVVYNFGVSPHKRRYETSCLDKQYSILTCRRSSRGHCSCRPTGYRRRRSGADRGPGGWRGTWRCPGGGSPAGSAAPCLCYPPWWTRGSGSRLCKKTKFQNISVCVCNGITTVLR